MIESRARLGVRGVVRRLELEKVRGAGMSGSSLDRLVGGLLG